MLLWHRLMMLSIDLQREGLNPQDVADIVKKAEQEIYDRVMDEVKQAVEDVVNQAEGKKAWEFLSEIKLSSSSGYLEITTDSNKLDYSLPQKQMRDALLKGRRSRRIFLKPDPNFQHPKSKDISSGLSNLSSRSLSGVGNMAEQMASLFNGAAHKSITRPVTEQHQVNRFVTVSQLQDPTTKWVLPPKEENLTSIVNEANHRLRFITDNIIDEIINNNKEEGLSRVRNA